MGIYNPEDKTVLDFSLYTAKKAADTLPQKPTVFEKPNEKTVTSLTTPVYKGGQLLIGLAAPGSTITVKNGKQTVSTTADESGAFSLTLSGLTGNSLTIQTKTPSGKKSTRRIQIGPKVDAVPATGSLPGTPYLPLTDKKANKKQDEGKVNLFYPLAGCVADTEYKLPFVALGGIRVGEFTYTLVEGGKIAFTLTLSEGVSLPAAAQGSIAFTLMRNQLPIPGTISDLSQTKNGLQGLLTLDSAALDDLLIDFQVDLNIPETMLRGENLLPKQP